MPTMWTALRGRLVVVFVMAAWTGLGVVVTAQDPTAARLLDEADEARQWAAPEARRLYQEVVDRFPTDTRAPLALLRIAESYWRAGEAASASMALDDLRRRYPDAPSIAGAYVLEGAMLQARASGAEDLRQARTALEYVAARFGPDIDPDPTWRREAGIRLGQIARLLGELDLAAAEFLTLLEDEPVLEGQARARLGLADVFLQQRRWREGAEVLQRVVDAGAGPDAAAAAREAAGVASRRLGLLYRTTFRPSLGRPAWTTVRTLPAPGEGWRDPIGVAVSDDGQVLVADEGLDLALTFDTQGTLVRTSASNDLRLPWWWEDGAYVLDEDAVQPPGVSEPWLIFGAPTDGERRRLTNLRAGGRDAFGGWVVVDTDDDRVIRFDRDRRYRSTVVDDRRDTEAVDVAIDTRGRLWVLDRDQDRILRFGIDGQPEGAWTGHEWRRPEALTVDAVGNVYVLDRDAGTIDVLDSDGRPTVTVGPVLPDGTELRSPRDVAVDGAGRLYIADRDLNAVFVLE